MPETVQLGATRPKIIGYMRRTLTTYIDDFLSRGDDTAFARRRGLRVTRWSYGLVARTAFQFARELDARAIGRGDRVLLWAENGPEWVASFLGCLAHGAVVVPLDLQSEPGFVSRVERQVGPKLAVLDSRTRDGAELGVPVLQLEQLGEQLSRHSSAPYAASVIDQNDTAEIVFTSGTTSEPKGVLITHRNLLANLVPLEREIRRYLKYERLVHPIRFLNLLPLSHVFGQLMGIFVPQLLGGEVFFQESLSPSRVIETVKHQRISVVIAVPRILEALREKIERDYEARGELERFHEALADARRRCAPRRWWDFRAVHSMFGWKFWAFISGGATLSPETEEFWDRLGFAVIQGYGMTETASLVSVNHPFKSIRGSIGKVMPGQQVRLAADGEILVRGENVSPGYWRGGGDGGAADDGWFRTGDVGEMNTDGALYFKGRKKEVIVTAAGMKIFPEDLEQILDRQPEVKASAVVASAGPNGPEPLAVLILRRQEADVGALLDRANQSMAQYQRIRRWFIWPEEDFPRTPTQKVRKRLVAERAGAASASAFRPGERSSAAAHGSAVDGIVSQIGTGRNGVLDSSTKLGVDLKLDSLGRIELLSAIEDRYEVELDEAAFTEATTLGDVERMIREGKREEVAPYPYPRWQQRPPLGWLRIAFFHIIVLPAARIIGRPGVRGRERLRDVRGPLVFICNHVTIVDHALILLALPGRFGRRMAIAMDGEMLREWLHPSAGTNPLTRMRYLLQYILVVFFFNVFSMPRKSGFRRSFAFAGDMMDRGCSILVFPEGRRTESGTMNPFVAGAGLLVSSLGAPVVPMRIDGLWELAKANRHFAKAGEISVAIGEPVDYSPHDEPGHIASDLAERVRNL